MWRINLSFILDTARVVVDIAVVWLLLFYIIKIVRNNVRTMQIFKGVIVVILVKAISTTFGLKTVAWLADNVVAMGFLAIIIIFQPELRSILEKLGQSTLFSKISTLTNNEKDKLIFEVESALLQLAATKTGALVSIEKTNPLADYMKTGTPLNAVVTHQLLTSIFVTTTILHDGAVIIQGNRIAAASAYFPPTNQDLPTKYGARHRAAVGISELTDAITLVVSEETGKISAAMGGQLILLKDEKELHDFLLKHISEEDINVDLEESGDSYEE